MKVWVLYPGPGVLAPCPVVALGWVCEAAVQWGQQAGTEWDRVRERPGQESGKLCSRLSTSA